MSIIMHLLDGEHPIVFHFLVVSGDGERFLSGSAGHEEHVLPTALVRETADLCLPVED